MLDIMVVFEIKHNVLHFKRVEVMRGGVIEKLHFPEISPGCKAEGSCLLSSFPNN